MAEVPKRKLKLLQYPVIRRLLENKGRLNPQVPPDLAGDCGANSIYLLGLISEDAGIKLSTKQNKCREILRPDMKHVQAEYIYRKFLFTDPSKNYFVIVKRNFTKFLKSMESLLPGNGVIVLMTHMSDAGVLQTGHFVVFGKHPTKGTIVLLDLQQNRIVKYADLLQYMATNNYNYFITPTEDVTSGGQKTQRNTRANKTKKYYLRTSTTRT